MSNPNPIIERFRKKFPSFEGVGAPYPIFKDTPNRLHIEQFLPRISTTNNRHGTK